MENYYIERINSVKQITRIFGIIPIPVKSPLTFMVCNLILSLGIEIVFGTYLISLLVAILISYEVYRKNKIKMTILENCLIEESFMQEELERYGIGEFENDSPYVTDSDRDYIFRDSMNLINKKNHHKIW